MCRGHIHRLGYRLQLTNINQNLLQFFHFPYLDTHESQVLLHLIPSVRRRQKIYPTDQVEVVVTDIVLPKTPKIKISSNYF